MDYRKSPIVHVPMSLIIQMPELRVGERLLLVGWSTGNPCPGRELEAQIHIATMAQAIVNVLP
jgi:hypothetical protein